MADGLKVEGNEFDYANLEKQQAAAKAGAPIDLVAKNDYSSKAPELQDANYVGGSVKDDTNAGAAKLSKFMLSIPSMRLMLMVQLRAIRASM